MTTHAEFTARGYTFLSFEVTRTANRFKTAIKYIRPNHSNGDARIVITTTEHDKDCEVRQSHRAGLG